MSKLRMTPEQKEIVDDLSSHAAELFQRKHVDTANGITMLALFSCWAAVWAGVKEDDYIAMLRKLYAEMREELHP